MAIKNTILLLIIATILISCKSSDKRKKFNTASEYFTYVDQCIKKDLDAYNKSFDFVNGKKYCMQWADSLHKTAQLNVSKLNQIQPFKGDSTFTEAAKELNNYLGGEIKADINEYQELVFSDHSDNGGEIEIYMLEIKNKIEDRFEPKILLYNKERERIIEKNHLEYIH